MSAHSRLWHPFADMAAVSGSEFVVDRAEGVWVWTADGRRCLDATSSLWYANVGHGRAEIAEAVGRQLRQLDAYSIFNDYANPPALRLAERLAELAPMPDPRVFLATGGGDGIETAAKLSRRYWSLVGEPRRTHLIGRRNAYHGSSGFGIAVGGIEPNRVGFAPLMGDVSLVAYDSLAELEAEFAAVGPERVAAVFVEPVIGAGGVLHPPPGYLTGVAELCSRHGALLVLDEVICAFGRLGEWFAAERFGVQPDLIVFAKGVTSGYQPLGGVIASARVAEPFWSVADQPFNAGSTFAGHPSCCVAALVNLEIIEREDLLARSRALESELERLLAPLAASPLVEEVRAGLGLMAAVQLDSEAMRNGLRVLDIFRAARERGVLVRPLHGSIAVSPPLTIELDQLALIPEAIQGALDEVGREVPGSDREES